MISHGFTQFWKTFLPYHSNSDTDLPLICLRSQPCDFSHYSHFPSLPSSPGLCSLIGSSYKTKALPPTFKVWKEKKKKKLKKTPKPVATHRHWLQLNQKSSLDFYSEILKMFKPKNIKFSPRVSENYAFRPHHSVLRAEVFQCPKISYTVDCSPVQHSSELFLGA